ncbi:MAG: cupin domain-containing protein [Pseudomonadota bacterium]
MPTESFPQLIAGLPPYEGRFEAFQLNAERCTVLFASYPAGTRIEEHRHETRNCGVITRGELILTTAAGERRFGVGDWYELEPNEAHAARFDVETAEIEFWFEPG